MTIEDIDKQAIENPPTYEEAKQQFVEMTQALGLKHTFTFDEAYEIGKELRRRKEAREKIQEFEQKIVDASINFDKEKLMEMNPIKHYFADGLYIRERINEAEQIIVTKIHNKENAFFLMEGDMAIMGEDGVEHVSAPYHGITKPGTKRIILAKTRCKFITVHALDGVGLEEAEDEVVADNFDDPKLLAYDLERLIK
jgi:hypothetical protein